MNLSKSLRTTLFVAVCGMSTALFAQQTKTVDSGLTTVQLSSTFLSALSSLNVTPGVIAPTHLNDGIVSFPITGGAIDLTTASGNFLHSGGLTLTANGIETRLQSFIIDTTDIPLGRLGITGLVTVNGKLVGRLPLFFIDLPVGFALPLNPTNSYNLDLKQITVKLTVQAAAALNGVYNVKAFQSGLPIGIAEVNAFIDPTTE